MSALCSEPCYGHMESCTSPTQSGDQIILSCLPQHLQFSFIAEAANLDVCSIFSITVKVLSHCCYYGVLSVLRFKWESTSQGLLWLCSAQHWSMVGISSSAPHKNPLIFSPAAHCAVSISKILFVRAIDIKPPRWIALVQEFQCEATKNYFSQESSLAQKLLIKYFGYIFIVFVIHSLASIIFPYGYQMTVHLSPLFLFSVLEILFHVKFTLEKSCTSSVDENVWFQILIKK